jgi:iron complex outermembrane receptor protein/vitamin B12 transporter
MVGAVALAMLVLARPAAAQQGSVSGVVADPLGARVPGATVTLSGGAQQAGETKTGEDGAYTLPVVPGRYHIVVNAPGFEAFTSEPIYVGAGGRELVDVTLRVGPLEQAVLVTAAASEIPQSQTGAPVTVIDARTLDALNKPDVLEALRLVPGAQIVQTGARGGTAAMFIRGGASNFNKVLVDGIAVNDIGGGFDFAQLSTTGVEQVEVLRQTNSVMYGSDALAGVVSITTRRGRTRAPELTFAADGGNLGTWSSNVGVGGVARRFDYYSAYSRFETDNDVPNNGFENGTYAGRFGVALGGNTDLSGTLRRTDTELGSPNAFTLFGIADDSSQKADLTYLSVAARTQFTDRWQSTIRFGSTDQTSRFSNPAPTGQPFDPFGFGPNYLGNQVTVRGANGYTATGRAILDFGGTFPSLFESRTTRRTLSGQTTFLWSPMLSIAGGARFEREQGYDDPEGEPTATRNNGGAFVEARATVLNRHYVTAGVGIEHNAAFGEEVTPRLSIASYLREPSAAGLGDTKIVLNAGTGLKAPSLFQEQSSLFELVQGTPAAAGVDPIGPERSTSVDVGVEQGFAGGRARARAAYFYNTFDDLIEFLDRAALVRAGVPPEVANATPFGGYINSQSYRAQGAELSFDAALPRDIRVMASYTHLAAEVTEAFSASISFNPAFPGIAIGAFSPLVGQRPFRRPPNSGTVAVMYAPGRAEVAFAAYFAGKRDDGTFLSDPFFGNSLLLPNRDLDAAYQKVDLSGAYQVHPRLGTYVSIENLLDNEYEASFGFPALPFTARFGFRVTLGGETP